jgi:hypothetical protein
MQTARDFFRLIVIDDLQIGFLLLYVIQRSASVNSIVIKKELEGRDSALFRALTYGIVTPRIQADTIRNR